MNVVFIYLIRRTYIMKAMAYSVGVRRCGGGVPKQGLGRVISSKPQCNEINDTGGVSRAGDLCRPERKPEKDDTRTCLRNSRGFVGVLK